MTTTPPEIAVGDLSAYQRPRTGRSIRQLLDSLLPYLGIWAGMVLLHPVSVWASLALAPFAAGFLVRLFIIFHDCGHGSFFRSRRANETVGFFLGVLTLTPHHQWWRDHSLHHATSGNLDKRGHGDVWTMTVEDYLSAPRWKRIVYWFVRHPLFMLAFGPILIFVILHRFPSNTARRKEKLSVLWTNLGLVAVFAGLSLLVGWKGALLLHGVVTLISGAAGIWLFYVQHQFEDTYWERTGKWDHVKASVMGSSYYRLPRVLQFFSGNIGFHHIHHLAPRIPNYMLEKCHFEVPAFRRLEGISLRESLRCARYRLWDERNRRLIGFSDLRRMQRTES